MEIDIFFHGPESLVQQDEFNLLHFFLFYRIH